MWYILHFVTATNLKSLKNRLLTYLANPFVIALILSLVSMYFLPDFFSKYKLTHENTKYYSAKDKIYFVDLDGDSISERIIVRKNSQNKASYLIYNSEDAVIDQFNFQSFPHNRSPTIGFLDFDKNGYKEVYNLTYNGDSIFLNIVEPLKKNGIYRLHIFVDSLPKYRGENLSENNEIRVKDFVLQNFKEKSARVAFECSTGFFQYPRNVYAYDFESDSIFTSEYLVNSTFINHVLDIDNDGNDELLLSSASSDNKIDSTFTKRSDASSWLNVLDDDLSFKFPPIENPNVGSVSIAFGLAHKKDAKIMAIFRPRHNRESQRNLSIYDLQGNLLSKTRIDIHMTEYYLSSDNELHLYDGRSGLSETYNSLNGKLKRKNFLEQNLSIKYLDIDQDGKNEIFALNNPKRTLTIYRNNFKDSSHIRLPNRLENNQYRLGLYHITGGQTKLWVQNLSELYTYDYRVNKMYLLRYPMYLGMYLVILALVVLIMRAQGVREERKRALESQIAELQLKTIKNQLDPHFVFNALNTISEMTLTDNKLEADKYITSLSGLMRRTLKGSDKIAHSLEEELNYINNYLEIQQLRLQNRFDFELDMDSQVDTTIQVPKHVLYTYVENAIKHGLASRNVKGKLKIIAKPFRDGVQLEVLDNGGGLGNSKANVQHNTGTGLKIMEQLFALYQKRFKKKVEYNLRDISLKNEKGLGVIITIWWRIEYGFTQWWVVKIVKLKAK